jgi:hypothetical protein
MRERIEIHNIREQLIVKHDLTYKEQTMTDEKAAQSEEREFKLISLGTVDLSDKNFNRLGEGLHFVSN